MRLLHQSYQLKRFHLAIILIFLSIVVALMLRYFAMLEAIVEQTAVSNTLLNIQQQILLHNLLLDTDKADKTCSVLDKPDFFNGIASLTSTESPTPGQWHYDAKRHSLHYFLRAKSYFRSSFAQEIKIGLYCKQGLITYRISPFKWCVKMHFWGCEHEEFE